LVGVKLSIVIDCQKYCVECIESVVVADFILVFGQFRKFDCLISCSRNCSAVVENYLKVEFKILKNI